MSESQQSDILKNLVKFLIYLAIVGIVIALVLYFIGVIPVQRACTPCTQELSMESMLLTRGEMSE